MATIPTQEPSAIVAGDTIKFLKTLQDYPAPEWTLTYYLVKDSSAASPITFSSTASGSGHLVNVSSATTTNWQQGRYRIIGRVQNDAGEKYTVFQGFLEIRPNLALGAVDVRSHARKCLDAIEAVLEGRATKEILQWEIEGQKIHNIPHEDLLKFRDYYRAEVKNEELRAAGKSTRRRILLRFT